MKKIKSILLILMLVSMLAGCGSRSYKQGMEELEKGNYKEAAVLLEEYVAENDDAADAFRGLGMAYWEQQDYEKALNAFEHALKAGCEETGALYHFLGDCTLKTKQPEKALEYYQKGLKQEGNSAELTQEMKFNSIAACEQMKDWEGAKEKLASYIEEYPDDKEAMKEAEFLETR